MDQKLFLSPPSGDGAEGTRCKKCKLASSAWTQSPTIQTREWYCNAAMQYRLTRAFLQAIERPCGTFVHRVTSECVKTRLFGHRMAIQLIHRFCGHHFKIRLMKVVKAYNFASPTCAVNYNSDKVSRRLAYFATSRGPVKPQRPDSPASAVLTLNWLAKHSLQLFV
eukprot:1825489-Pleurochrysis_carterae.AAC.10